MAKKRKKSKADTSKRKTKSPQGVGSAVRQALAKVQKRYEKAETRSRFQPPNGEYRAVLCGMTVDPSAKSKKGTYLALKPRWRIIEGKLKGQEWNELYTDIPSMVQGVKTQIGLAQFKGLVAAFNGGQEIEDLVEAVEFLEGIAQEADDQTQIAHLVVRSRETPDGQTRYNTYLNAVEVMDEDIEDDEEDGETDEEKKSKSKSKDEDDDEDLDDSEDMDEEDDEDDDDEEDDDEEDDDEDEDEEDGEDEDEDEDEDDEDDDEEEEED